MKRFVMLFVALAFVLMATPAFAGQCPARIRDARAAIEKAEQAQSKPADVIKKAKDLVDQAVREHDTGQHGDSIAHAREALGLVQ